MQSKLANLKTPGFNWNDSEQALEVSTPEQFTQAAGYLKYALRTHGPVYSRGQTALHQSMLPALFRGVTSDRVVRQRLGTVRRAAGDKAEAFVRNTPGACREPLLQHYGWRTSWLDLVDNAWVALWFGAHECRSHRNFQRYEPSGRAYAYVVLLQLPEPTPESGECGLWRCGDYRLVDLRRAAPSLYLRPHAQHALLVTRRDITNLTDADLQPLVVGTIKVAMHHARLWLGAGGLASVQSLFPAPHSDLGFDTLLKHGAKGPPVVGDIAHITP